MAQFLRSTGLTPREAETLYRSHHARPMLVGDVAQRVRPLSVATVP